MKDKQKPARFRARPPHGIQWECPECPATGIREDEAAAAEYVRWHRKTRHRKAEK